MSQSEVNKPRFWADARLQDVRLVLLDAKDRVIQERKGSISANLPVGLYTLRSEVNGRIIEKIFRHGNEGTQVPSFLLNMPYSSVPIEGMAQAYTYYREFANGVSRNKTSRIPSVNNSLEDSELFIMLRYPSREIFEKQNKPEWNLTDFSISYDGLRVEKLNKQNSKVNEDIGAAGFSAASSSGQYLLNYGGKDPRQFPVPLFSGWQTQVFLTFNPKPHWASLRVHFNRIGEGISETSQEIGTAELALDQLQTGLFDYPKGLMQTLLHGKFQHPLWGFLGLYIYLNQRKAVDIGLINTVLSNMESHILQTSGCPDLQILRLIALERVGKLHEPQEPLTEAPLFKIGMDSLVRLSADYPELIPENKLFKQIVLTGKGDSPFNTWEGTFESNSKRTLQRKSDIDEIEFYDLAEMYTTDKPLLGRSEDDEDSQFFEHTSIRESFVPKPSWVDRALVDFMISKGSVQAQMNITTLSRHAGVTPSLVRSSLHNISDDSLLMDVLMQEQQTLIRPEKLSWAREKLPALIRKILAGDTDYP